MRKTSAIVLLGLLLLKTPSYSQVPSRLEFEVASVRAAGPRAQGEGPAPQVRSGGPGTSDPGRLVYSKADLSTILAESFGVYWNQISGPEWIFTDRFDIAANVPSGSTKEQGREMLRNLLIDRLGLTYHRGTKVERGYELTVAEGGPALKPPLEDYPIPALPRGEYRATRKRIGPRVHTYVRFSDAPISNLTDYLSNQMSPGESMIRLGSLRRAPQTPILDNTGLTGTYDFAFDYDGQPFFTADALPRIVSAIKSSLLKQLGLKMTEAKVPVNTVVIDHINQTPTDN